MEKHAAKVIPDVIVSTSLSKCVRIFCLGCAGGRSEVRKCPTENCPLWPFRFGKNPFTKRGQNMSEENKKKRSENLKLAHKLGKVGRNVK